MMDGFAELQHLIDVGVSSCAGLWINRWQTADSEPLLCQELRHKYEQEYETTDVESVKRLINECALI